MIYSFTLPIAPVAKGRPRLGRGNSVFTPAKTRVFENHLKWLLRMHYKQSPISGPVDLKIVFALKRPKSQKSKYPSGHVGDLDNYAKAVCDGANEVLWVDDCQIVSLALFKVYADEPSISISFSELSNECIHTKKKEIK